MPLFQEYHEQSIGSDQDFTEIESMPERSLSCVILDDDRIDAEYLAYQLKQIENYKFDIVSAKSIEEARRVTQSRVFDLYLIDFWMGHETSIAFINELASQRNHKSIVLLSSLEEDRFQEMGLRAGAVQFLSKSELTPVNLESCIRSARSTAEKLENRDDQLKSASFRNKADIEWMSNWTRNLLKQFQNSSMALGKSIASSENLLTLQHDIEHVSKRLQLVAEIDGQSLDRCDLLTTLKKFQASIRESSHLLQVLRYPPSVELSISEEGLAQVFETILELLQQGVSSKQSITLSSETDSHSLELIFATSKFTNFHNAQLALLKTQSLVSLDTIMSTERDESIQTAQMLLETCGGNIRFSSKGSEIKLIVRLPYKNSIHKKN